MELKQKFYDYLVRWKAERPHQCLLVEALEDTEVDSRRV